MNRIILVNLQKVMLIFAVSKFLSHTSQPASLVLSRLLCLCFSTFLIKNYQSVGRALSLSYRGCHFRLSALALSLSVIE